MAERYYSVERVAELLGLHVKTVRGYVRDGRLKATRIGRQYRIAAEDLEAFTGRPAPAPAAGGPHAETSAVVRVDGIGRDEVIRLSNTVVAAAGSRPRDGGGPLRVETVYDEERAALTIVIIGALDGAAELLKIVDLLVREERATPGTA
ncbi:helix-turn-helix domain-containing protein [Nonomuraea roseoviolacea subsp. roseoviolacea]|uniref:Excisionase family DNA binding protein n=1 Tax=Nonomuraea roseoviolacea subsp. carminata TaxID=160689 RepID=A0ABT1KAX6_9ACTN|nr:helix-turn-helix domain-containing protein [Nonomuraea roseoviolacea]MCP2351116.1 excisionase family DNA binding protein [Nonomuraea roseoviolacea subsp. carminata]